MSRCVNVQDFLRRFRGSIIVVAIVAAVGLAAYADEAPSAKNADEAAIRAAAAAFTDAFNRGDAKAVAAHWTEDGDYVDQDGQSYAGRPAIQAEYAAFFAANPGVQMRVMVDAVRVIGDKMAIEDGRVAVGTPPVIPLATGRYTAVHVKQEGVWLMTSVRDAALDVASAPADLNDLDFLVGQWTAQNKTVRVNMVTRWVAEKSYLQRTFEVAEGDKTTSSGIQIIGCDPVNGQITSWNFTSQGGYSVGVWTPHEQGWIEQCVGVTGDGMPTSATNILSKTDGSAFTWSSMNRSVGGQSLPDLAGVTLTRK